MIKEDKQLLFQDLCARLPYGVKVLDNSHKDYGVSKIINIGFDGSILVDNEMDDIQYYPLIDDIKPYLRPMSSMTEEECIELGNIEATIENVSEVIPNVPYYIEVAYSKQIDWLNAHHFDYRGLIPKGLAIEVTKENNPYKPYKD